MAVVARYKENTTWLNECNAFRGLDYRIYQKELSSRGLSHPPRVNLSLHTEVVPNVGYECASYMKYIVDHYDRLPEVMYFLHGNPFEHCSGLQRALVSDRLYDYGFYMFSRFNYRYRASGWPHFWPHQVLPDPKSPPRSEWVSV